MGEYIYCDGLRGAPYNKTFDDLTTAYNGVPQGFPEPDIGSYAAVGLDAGVCFDRHSRLGAYGLGADTKESTTLGGQVDLSKNFLGKLQNECLERNQARYERSTPPDLRPGLPGSARIDHSAIQNLQGRASQSKTSNNPRQSYKSRTAVLIRSWDMYEYQENDFQAIRSLVSELSLLSGGEYHVFLFVNVKDLDIPIFSDPGAHEEALRMFVPAELRDMAILWSEEVCQKSYPKVGEWSVYWQQFMPLQWFSMTHPEFDNVWNWEMDARYIGQHYHFVEQISNFARNQPRKYLWERNSRYYIPAVHGSYEEYINSTNDIIATTPHIKTVWGPDLFSSETQVPLGPRPPTSESEDNFNWGVGEEADFITLLPMWDPRETVWSYRDKLFNYPPSPESTEDRPYPHVPRRVFINTLARFSKKLLHAMHIENTAGLAMASEMWPSSIALQHGLKAVYAPHPIWLSHHWPGRYADFVFNADGWGAGSLPGGGDMDTGRGVAYNATAKSLREPQTGTGPNGEGKLGRWSQERDAPYSPDREHNFAGWSWYFWSDFPRVLYSRWMGWKAGFSIVTIDGRMVTDTMGVVGGPDVSFTWSCVSKNDSLTYSQSGNTSMGVCVCPACSCIRSRMSSPLNMIRRTTES